MEYLLRHGDAVEATRLAVLARLEDPGTIGLLEAIGVGDGWEVLEVGAGRGTVVEWLCERVGNNGGVTATDLDPRFLGELVADNLTVLTHDVSVDPLPDAAYDLVHARHVLIHLSDPAAAISRLVQSLKPGGWLLVEEADLTYRRTSPPSAVRDRFLLANTELVRRAGLQADLGACLPAMLVAAGLADVQGAGRFSIDADGRLNSKLQLPTIRAALLSTGLVTDVDLDAYEQLMDDPKTFIVGPPTYGVMGRRPSRDARTGQEDRGHAG